MTTENKPRPKCLACNCDAVRHTVETSPSTCLDCMCPLYTPALLKCTQCRTADVDWFTWSGAGRARNRRTRTKMWIIRRVDEDITATMRRHQACFKCAYWLDYLPLRDESVRVNGRHYMIGAAGGEAVGTLKGFDGARFRIRFCDGRSEVVTTNLWYQGEIPRHFRHLFPDNAAFVQENT